MSAPIRQTRDQRMAGKALTRVQEAATDTVFRKKYRSRAMSFPSMVLQAGLAQSTGFLLAKSGGKVRGDEYGQYLNDLAQVAGHPDGKSLATCAIDEDVAGYRLLTRDVLDAAGWIKRMSQALIFDEKGGNDDH